MSETFECPKCGYQWKQGQHGGHSCSDRLLQQLKDVMTERNSILADWNAIVSASGSKTHGGAVGHVAQMRAELEAVKADKEMQQRRGDCHWETLRSIRDIAQTSGDIQRIIQWVNDAGGGYTESNEATMAKLMDQIEELKSERNAVKQCYTCKSWQGDKAKVLRQIEINPDCMDKFKGWPAYGGCGINYEWLEITILGDARAYIEVPANFGCNYWN